MRASLAHAGEDHAMPADPYAERLAKVRQRFVTTLESKIEDTYADLPKLSGGGTDVTGAMEETYRRIHGIVGIGPTVGFTATGKAARSVENVLLEPQRAARGLAPNEIDAFRKALHMLRETARQELQTTFMNWR
jgi:chemotaxis protein histidine kinase CheA